jgi:hypothetical protein
VTKVRAAIEPARVEASGAGEGTATSPAEELAPAHTDWLYHHLRVTGDPAEVVAFRQAAAGAGVIPWQHSLGRAEEDWFHLLVAPPPPLQRSLSLEGARILAGQLRTAAEERMRLVAERSGESRACPLDLHRLLPAPEEVLRLGPEHPAARVWLWANWGTTQALRHVVELPVPKRRQPLKREPGLLWLGFWSADWTPWAAIRQLRERWQALQIAAEPHYDDP